MKAAGELVEVTRSGRRAALLPASLVLLALFASLLAAVEGHWEPLVAADRGMAGALHDLVLEHRALATAGQVASDLGGSATWWVVHAVTTLHLLVRRLLRLAAFVAVTAAGGGLLTAVLKVAVARERPAWADPLSSASGFAFPSGHTTGSAIGVGVLLLLALPVLAPRWRPAAVGAGVVLALAVGASRVVLGVHWASDVLGAWLLALGWVLAMAALFRVRHTGAHPRRPSSSSDAVARPGPARGTAAGLAGPRR